MRQPYPKPLPISLAPWTGYLRTSAHAGKSTSKRPAMAANVLVDAGFLVALLSRRDAHQGLAVVPAAAVPSALEDLRGSIVGGLPSARAPRRTSSGNFAAAACGRQRLSSGRGA